MQILDIDLQNWKRIHFWWLWEPQDTNPLSLGFPWKTQAKNQVFHLIPQSN
jgi:hypothetical protein